MYGHMPGMAMDAPILHCPDFVPDVVGKIRMRCRLPGNVTVINPRAHSSTITAALSSAGAALTATAAPAGLQSRWKACRDNYHRTILGKIKIPASFQLQVQFLMC